MVCFLCVTVSRASKILVDGRLLSLPSSSCLKEVLSAVGVEIGEGEVAEVQAASEINGHQYPAVLEDKLELLQAFGRKFVFFRFDCHRWRC